MSTPNLGNLPNRGQARIINKDKGGEVLCMFNPTEFTYSKSAQWERGPGGGKDAPKLTYKGGAPASIKMQLFFDTYGQAKSGRPEDVRNYTSKVWNLMMVDKSLNKDGSPNGRPPKVVFMWGNMRSFEGIITNISQQFTLFTPDGTPVRATLDVTFEQALDENDLPMQNPTSGGLGGERLWTVQDGDTLAWIAYQEFGDSTQWRRIAEANRLGNVRRLTPGQVLIIPVE